VRHFGELAVECAPVYYMYGAALLCKAQEERDVFGAPVQDASAARDRKADGAAAAPAAGPTCAPDAKGKGKAAAAPEEESSGEDEDEEGSSDDEDGGGGGEEEMSDLQLAWENLEYARVIYSGGVTDEGGAEGGSSASTAAPAAPAVSRHAPEHTEALAQVHVKLGQVSAEEEQFEAALTDYDKALALFGTLSPTPHRRIAGILYDSAYAMQQLERNDEALARFGQAVAACQRRLTELRMAAPAGADAAAEGSATEAAEIGALISHLRALEEDLRMSAAEQARTKDALKAAFAGMAGAASGAAAFDAPRMAAAAPAANLGVAGRGVTRITPAAAGAPATAMPQPAPMRRVTPQAEPAAAPKRMLEDALASGGAAGQAGDAAKAAKPAAEGEADGCKQQ
jgi:nuclear autoantigenic sperm protein